jgi:uncharacterized delta-60 repeat protein
MRLPDRALAGADRPSSLPLRDLVLIAAFRRRMLATAPRRRVAAAVVLGAIALASVAWAAPQPGRAVVGLGGVDDSVDGGSVDGAAALPDGDIVLVGGGPIAGDGFSLAELTPDGFLDPRFGQDGLVHIGLSLTARQLLREPDGKLLVLAASAPLSRHQLPQLAVVRLDGNGVIDSSYGSHGVAPTGIEQGMGGLGAADAAVTATGELVVAGTTGSFPPSRDARRQWVVEELTTAGTPDPAFGGDGIATIALKNGLGFEVAALPGGAVVTTGLTQDSLSYLTRLTAAGRPDPAFAGGAPVATGLTGAELLAQPDGSVTLGGATTLVRYTAAGTPDSTFGTITLPSGFDTQQLLAGPGSEVLVTGMATSLDGDGFTRGTTTLDVETISPAAGRHRTVRVAALRLPFGGGYSSLLVSPLAGPGLAPVEDTFSGQDVRLLRREDGSYVVVGAITIDEPTDNQGDGVSLTDFAAAAFTPTFAPEMTFGSPPPPIRVSIRVPAQQTATDVQRRAIELALNANCQGLADLTIRDSAGVIAQSTYPLFDGGPHTDAVALTHLGADELGAHRTVSVTIRATVRDLYASALSTNARATVG